MKYFDVEKEYACPYLDRECGGDCMAYVESKDYPDLYYCIRLEHDIRKTI